jgi:flagellar basal body-associated protein FliL
MKRTSSLTLLILFLALVSPVHVVHAAEAASKAGDADTSKKQGDDTFGGRFAGDPIYIHMSPMVLPVINENGVEQLITIIMDIQVKDFDSADQMHNNMPRVQDALMRALYGGLGQGVLRNGKLVDIAKIKNKAIAAVSEVIGNGNVRDVLIQGVAQRML